MATRSMIGIVNEDKTVSAVKDIIKLELSGNPKFWPIINENLI
jgi:hypothetical protein